MTPVPADAPWPEAPVLHVLSGAGLSAESGVATFRGATGLWNGVSLARVCHFATWKEHRTEVFDFYRARRQDMSIALPNPAHVLLARWQATWGEDRVRLLTQNVDDLLERAGATCVHHLHGSLDQLQCTACGHRFPVEDEDYQEHTRCTRCNSLRGVKPGVVFFHEPAPQYLHLRRLARRIRAEDVLIVVGTSLQVVGPEHLMSMRRRGHAFNWQVNPRPESMDWFGENLATGASEGLAALSDRLGRAMAV